MSNTALNMDRSRRALPVAAGCAAAALLLIAAACSAPRTFPSPSGDPGFSADSPPLPQVITDALVFAHHEIAPKTPLVYNLPAETNEPAWPTYERRLAPARAMCPGDTGVWTVELARVDGSKAQVDIQYPSRDGFYQRVTVHLTGATAGVGYKPEYVQYWRVPVKDPVCNTPVSVQERQCGKAAAVDASAVAAQGSAAARPAVKAGAAVPGAAPTGRTEDPTK